MSQVVTSSSSAPEPCTHAPDAGGKGRWSVLDTFRGLAVLLMIQGHTFTALTLQSEFSGPWHRLYRLFHGLTAPMFLVGGGLAYGMVSARRRAQAGEGTAALDPRIVRRGFMLIVIGYLLQLPQMRLWRLPEYPELFRKTFAIGPLQLIGACLIVSELVWALSRILFQNERARRFHQGSILTLCLAIAACSPWVWQGARSMRWFAPVGMWFDGQGGSLFPVFPWATFFFLGVLAAALVPRARRAPRGVAFGLIAGSAALAWGIYVAWLGGEQLAFLYGEHDFWRANPMYVTFRGLLVLLMLGGLMLLEPLFQRARRRFPRSGRLFDVLSRQSLVAYVTHLFVIYGSPFTVGLIRFGRVFDLVESSLLFAWVALYTLAIAVLWDHVKPAELWARGLRRVRMRLRSPWLKRSVRPVDAP